jgi:hypothetical protein
MRPLAISDWIWQICFEGWTEEWRQYLKHILFLIRWTWDPIQIHVLVEGTVRHTMEAKHPD